MQKGRLVREYTRVSTALISAFLALVAVLNVAVYALAEHFGWYLYTKEHYEHRVGEPIHDYLSALSAEGEVSLLFCMNEEELRGDVVYRLVWETARQLAERHDFITVETVNIFTDPERVERYRYETETDPDTGETTRRQINRITTQSVIIDGGAQFMVQPLSAFFVLNANNETEAYNGEEVMAAMVRWVLTDPHPTAYVSTNHGEVADKSFYNLLVCAGYRVLPIDLMQEELTDTAGILVVSNPRYDFIRGQTGVRAELEKIEEFLDAGGLLVMGIDPLTSGLVKLEAFLAGWGIAVSDATIRDRGQSITADGYTLVASYADSDAGATLARRTGEYGAGRVIVREASPLMLSEREGKEVGALLRASPDSAAYADGKLQSSEGNFTIAALSRDSGGGGAVFVVSSVYLAAHDALESDEYGNEAFLYSLLDNYAGATPPFGATMVVIGSYLLENLTMREAHLYTLLLVGVLPLAVAGAGVVVLRRRKNR